MSPKTFVAYHLTERFKLSEIRKLIPELPSKASGMELVYDFGDGSFFLLYNFGAVVFFDVPIERRERLLASLQNQISNTRSTPTTDQFLLATGESVDVNFDRVTVPVVDLATVSIVSLVLAQSVALDYFETVAEEVLSKSGYISEALEKRGYITQPRKEVIQFIGFCMNTKQKILGSTYLLDVPDPTWDNPHLEKLYRGMAEQFEIKDRYRVIEHKLEFIQDTLQVLTDLSYYRRSMLLEIAIVGLIAFEILLFLFEKL